VSDQLQECCQTQLYLLDVRLPPLFCGVTQRRLTVTDVSEQNIYPVFMKCLNLEDQTDYLYRNVGNYKSTPRNSPKQRNGRNNICCYKFQVTSYKFRLKRALYKIKNDENCAVIIYSVYL
jgi:hypothetical protein